MRNEGDRAPRGESGYDKNIVNRRSLTSTIFVCFIYRIYKCSMNNRSISSEPLGLCSRTPATRNTVLVGENTDCTRRTESAVKENTLAPETEKRQQWQSHGYTVLPRNNLSKNWRSMSWILAAPWLCSGIEWCHFPANTKTFSQQNQGIHQIKKNILKRIQSTPLETSGYTVTFSILREAHDEPTAGHLGLAKTLVRLACQYYWPEMLRMATKYVRFCVSCQKHKAQQ